MLRAIRSGDVDALVLHSASGPRVYTLQGLDAEVNQFRGEMLAQVSDAVIAVDEGDRITYLNAAAELLYGVTASNALGRSLAEIYQIRWLRPGDEVAAATSLREHGKWHGEMAHTRRDGHELYVESSITKLKDGDQQETGRLAVVRDATERIMRRNALVESEQFSRSLMEGSADCIKVLDVDGRMLRMNGPGLCLMEIDDFGPLTGQNWSAFWPQPAGPDIERAIESARSGETYAFQAFCPTAKGTPRWWDVTVSPVRDAANGPVVRLLSVSRDITEIHGTEARLRRSEIRYRRLFEAAHDGVLILDPDTQKIIVANPFMTRLLGYSHDELVGLELFQIGLTADAHASRDMLDKLKATKQVRYENLPLRTREGMTRQVEVVAHLYDEDGRSVVQCNVRDITERRRAEMKLKELEARHHLVLEACKIGTFHGDLKSGEAHWNSVEFELLGLHESEAPPVPATFFKYVHPDDVVSLQAAWDAGMEDKEQSAEFRIIRADGKERWMVVRRVMYPEGRDEQGQPHQRYVGVNFDVTDRKRVDLELRNSVQSMAMAAEATGIGFWERNVHSNVIRWDAQMFRHYGLPPTDDGCVSYETWRDAVLPEDLAENVTILNNTVKTNGQSAREFRIRRGDTGECRTMQSVEAMRDHYGDKSEWIVGTNVDITDRKRAEEHAQLLMAEVNHRAKNLLSVVQAVAQQTAKSGDPLTFAARLSDRISGLAASQDLLVKNLWKGVGLSELVTSQLAHFKDLIGTRIYLHGPGLTVTAAASQALGMAVQELATNAAKYGALSNLDGQVHVEWQLAAGQDSLFLMSWRERDGPQVKAPTRKGFGQTVIKRLVETSVDGNVEVDYAEGGFSWHMRTAAENVLVMAGGENEPE